MSLARCTHWADTHGLTVRVRKHGPDDYRWTIGHGTAATIDRGHATTEAHAWAAMWGAIGSLSADYLTRAEHLRALTPIHQAPASPDAADQVVLATVREHATDRPMRVTELTARTGIGPIAIWQHLNRLEARGLIHITATGEPLVSVPEAPPARQLSLEGDAA